MSGGHEFQSWDGEEDYLGCDLLGGSYGDR